MRFFAQYDLGIVIPTLILLTISLIVLSSVDFGLFQNQLMFSLIGIVCFIASSSINIRSLKNARLLFYVLSLVLLVSLFFVGVEVRGARRWVEFAGLRMQFSEIVKPFLIIAFASLLAYWKDKITLSRFVISIGFFLPIVLLLLRQPDLGNGFVYIATFGFMLFSAGLSLWYIAAALAFLAISFPVVWRLLAQYQKDRILTFLNPKHDPLGVGYNAIQSAIAVGSGLLFGRGLGRGVQSQLQFLPERHTDFIFATLSEEFGFLGSLVVLTLYFLVLLRLLRIAKSSNDTFASLVALGVFALLLSQTFINIGMNVGLVPITGVTLPLFSYGGSSLLSTMILLGFVNSLSRDQKQKEDVLEIR